MNTLILQKEVQQFLESNLDASPAKIALKKTPFEGISSSELATQLDGKQRARTKMPHWSRTAGVYYPPKLNMEQCSSELTARFKSSLIKEGAHLIDLTSGFGVDSFYFATRAGRVVSCERDAELAAISAHNASVLGADNILVEHTDGVDYILKQTTDHVDYIYLDPSRRVQTRKVFLLEECEPDLVTLQKGLLARSAVVISKLAPLLDISSALNRLMSVKDVYIVSVHNECKELLFVQEKGYEDMPTIHAVRLLKQLPKTFSFTYEEERLAIAEYSEPLSYLYEPDVALTKAGAFKTLARRYDIKKLHKHSHLYTSSQKISDFPGKIFSVEQVESFTDFKKNKNGLIADISARNFPLKTEEIKKKFKVRDGGHSFVFFTTTVNDQLTVIHTNRISE
ncbi:class I SAM-dependent methyltransferase [Sphingobacterium thalpophilum]|uniref:class I SAM-dependent methyltransferase n=1 Tax=Sphingobacterium thalpophilum TaxID=259 RepID=UPI003C788AEC